MANAPPESAPLGRYAFGACCGGVFRLQYFVAFVGDNIVYSTSSLLVIEKRIILASRLFAVRRRRLWLLLRHGYPP